MLLSRRRVRLLCLVRSADLVCLCGPIGAALGAQRDPGARKRLLVCLSQAGPASPQRLSWPVVAGDVCTLRGAGQQADWRAFFPTGNRGSLLSTRKEQARKPEDGYRAPGHPEKPAALDQVLPSSSAQLSSGALWLTHRSGSGSDACPDPGLGLCRKREDDAALDLVGYGSRPAEGADGSM